MGIQEPILCLLVGKCLFNFLPFLCFLGTHSQVSAVSLLILLMTDTTITGFLLCLWFGGWSLPISTETLFLRFLCFQNETYRSVTLLLPWVCFSEEWSRSRINRWGGIPRAGGTLSVQSCLLGLTCWLIAASYGKHIIPELTENPPVCNNWDWKCLIMYINGDRQIDWLVPAIGLALGATLFHNTMENRDYITWTKLKVERPLNALALALLPSIGTAVSFYVLPPFIAVNSWSILALDSLCGIFRFQIPEPLSTVYSADECAKVIKDIEINRHKWSVPKQESIT